MKKIPTIFERDWNGDKSLVTDTPNPKCDWVFAGEGIATRKWDGTACMVKDGVLYKRYDARVRPRPRFNQEIKKVHEKPVKAPPENFIAADEPDLETGHWPGWIPVGDGPEDHAHRDASAHGMPPNGTYELVGPKVQGNPDNVIVHTLVPHGKKVFKDVPRDFAGLKQWLAENVVEGIVWHHPDGRMAKLKLRDMGLPWPPQRKP